MKYADTNAFTDADQTRLAGLEANADVTDAANVEPLIDAHLNYSTATSGQFLKYNGTDYEWGTVDLTPYLALSGGTMTGTPNVPTIDFVIGPSQKVVECFISQMVEPTK